MSASGHRAKYRQLAETLKGRLLTYPNGRRLPSVRMLMKRLQVSQRTVMSALRVLEEEELISCRPGSGIYRSDTNRSRVISFCRPLTPGTDADQKECSLMAGCERRGWTLTVHRFKPSEVDVFAEDAQADGFVIMPEMITFHSPLLLRILENNIPRVVLGRDTGNIHLDFVSGDNAMTLTEVMRGLTARGHRRIAYLISEPHFHEVDESARCFTRLCQAFALEHHAILDVEVQYGQNGIHYSEDFLRKYLATLPGNQLPFTALVTCSSTGSIPALRILHEAGIRVPKDCSLCCLGMDANARYSIPSISNASAHHEERAESCLRILEKRFAGDKSPLLFEWGINSLCWRESVGPPPRKTLGPKVSGAGRKSR